MGFLSEQFDVVIEPVLLSSPDRESRRDEMIVASPNPDRQQTKPRRGDICHPFGVSICAQLMQYGATIISSASGGFEQGHIGWNQSSLLRIAVRI